jgi:hypothetical protein
LKLYVPKQLIQQGESEPFVWLADQSRGIARKTTVKTGAVGHNNLVEITGGLTVASRIISAGSDGLRDGDRIRVVGEDTTLGANSGTGRSGSHKMNRLPAGDNH